MQAGYTDWEEINVSDVATFCVPPGTDVRLEDDGSMVVATLPSEPATDVLLGLFPLRHDKSASYTALEKALRDFTNRCIAAQCSILSDSYEAAVDVDFSGVCCCQSVVLLENDRWWIARAYAMLGGEEMLLVHWNGPAAFAANLAMPVMVSLVPLFAITQA